MAVFVQSLVATFAMLGLAIAPAVAQTLRVAHDRQFAPFAESRNGQSVGLAVDLLTQAGARAGLTIEYIAVPFPELQKTLADGRADAIFPSGVNPERKLTFDFSSPLLLTGGALFMRAPEPTPDLKALAGKTVVTPRTGPLAAYIQKNAPDVKLVVTADYDESLGKLMSGEADAAALNVQVGARLAARLHPGKITPPSKMFFELPLAVAVPKGKSAETIAKLDRGIAAIRADGAWQRINTEWAAQ